MNFCRELLPEQKTIDIIIVALGGRKRGSLRASPVTGAAQPSDVGAIAFCREPDRLSYRSRSLKKLLSGSVPRFVRWQTSKYPACGLCSLAIAFRC